MFSTHTAPLAWNKRAPALQLDTAVVCSGATPPSARRVRFADDALCTYHEAPAYDSSDSEAGGSPSRMFTRTNAEYFGHSLAAMTDGYIAVDDDMDLTAHRMAQDEDCSFESNSLEYYFYDNDGLMLDDFDSPVSPASTASPATPVDELPDLTSVSRGLSKGGYPLLGEDSQSVIDDIDDAYNQLLHSFKELKELGEDEKEVSVFSPPTDAESSPKPCPASTAPLRGQGWSGLQRRGPSTLSNRPTPRLFAQRYSRGDIAGLADDASLPEINLDSDSDEDEPIRPFHAPAGRRVMKRTATQRQSSMAQSEYDSMGLWTPY